MEYIISEDEKIIKEIVKTDDELARMELRCYESELTFGVNKEYNRIAVFAKKRNKQYVFLGVYGDAECKKLEDGLFMMIYKKMSDTHFRSW